MNLTSLALLLLALICCPAASHAGTQCSPNGMTESMWKEGPDQFEVYVNKGNDSEVIANWSQAQAKDVSCTFKLGKNNTIVAVHGKHDSKNDKQRCELLAKKISSSSHPCAQEAIKILAR